MMRTVRCSLKSCESHGKAEPGQVPPGWTRRRALGGHALINVCPLHDESLTAGLDDELAQLTQSEEADDAAQ